MPATIAVLDGVPHVGLTAAEVDRVCADPDLAKLGVRDLPVAAALGLSGATTVSSTALLAAAAGHRRLRHRRARRRAPARGRHLRRVRRPDRAVADVAGGGLRRGEVDPRRPGDARAAGVAVGHRRRLPDDDLPRASTSPTPARPLDWSVDDPAQAAAVFAARRDARPGRRRRGQPAAGGRAARPGAARPRDRRRAGRRGRRPASAARTSPRSCSTTCTGPARARRWRSTSRLVLRNAELAGADRGGAGREADPA